MILQSIKLKIIQGVKHPRKAAVLGRLVLHRTPAGFCLALTNVTQPVKAFMKNGQATGAIRRVPPSEVHSVELVLYTLADSGPGVSG